MSNSQPRSRMRFLGVCAALALTLSLAACRQQMGAFGPTEVAARFLPEPPLEVFSPGRISNAVVSNELDLDRAIVEQSWHLEKMDFVPDTFPERGVVLHAAGQNAFFSTEVDFDAADIAAVEVEGEGLLGTSVFFWAAPGQQFSPDRKVNFESRNPDEQPTFYVADHPLWSGRIGRIRIHPTSKPKQTLLVESVRTVRYNIDQARLEESAHRTWQLTLGEETRPSRLAVESEPFRWQVEARPGDMLEFAIGLTGSARKPIRFSVWASGEKLEPTLLSEHVIDPANGEADVWVPVRTAIPVDRPEIIALDFSTTAPDGSDPSLDLGAWGSPLILRKGPAQSDRSSENIILISIDTLRSDHLSLYGYPRQTSPNLDAWAGTHAVVFDEVVASAPWTLPAHISMFSGLDAVTHGVNHGPRPGAVPLITEHLAAAGLSTIAVTGGGYLDPRFGINSGFDSYRSHSGRTESATELETGMNHLIDWLEDYGDRRFFAFFHTYEVHGPYRPRQPYFGTWNSTGFEGTIDAPTTGFDAENGYTETHGLRLRRPGEAPRFLDDEETQLAIDCYDAGIAFTDAQLGRLLDFLDASGLSTTTSVVITSDHGEALGEKGLASHAHLYDFNLLVPLIISAPDRGLKGKRVAEQVRLIDVAPTILDLAGLTPPSPLDGVSLLPLVEGAPATIPEEAWSYASKTNYGLSVRLGGRVKYIFNNTAWPPAYGREELYRLDAGGDGEDTNLTDENALRDELRGRAQKHLDERQRGIAVTIENRTETALRGRISIPEKQKLIATKIKAAGDFDQNLTVINGRTIGFEVRPKSRLVIVTENIEVDSLRVSGLPGDPLTGELDAILELDDTGNGATIAFKDGRWGAPGGADAQVRAVIHAEWRRRGTSASVGNLEEDPTVLQQLKALGYVDG